MKTISIIILFIFTSLPGKACTCNCEVGQYSVEDYLNAQTIFLGEVIQTTNESISAICTVKFKVTNKFKNVNQDTISINFDCKSSCSMSFEANNEYLIYAFMDQETKQLKTFYCSNTTNIDSNKIRKYVCSFWENLYKFYPDTYNFLETLSEDNPSYDSISYVYQRKEVEWKVQDVEYQIEQLNQLKTHSGKNKSHFYSTGQLNAEGRIKNGLPIGSWKFYYPDGHLKAKGRFKNGDKKGKWQYVNYIFEGDRLTRKEETKKHH